eukprot:1139719-Pelagomonas_calceolata.AAC.1
MACLVEGVGSVDSPTHTQKDCVKSDLSTLKLFAQWYIWVSRARSDQDSVRAAEGASSLIRNAGAKEVMLGQTVCAAYVHMHK